MGCCQAGAGAVNESGRQDPAAKKSSGARAKASKDEPPHDPSRNESPFPSPSGLTDADGEWQSMPLPPRQPEVSSPAPTRKQNAEPKASSASKARSTPQEPYDEEAADEPMALDAARHRFEGKRDEVPVLFPEVWLRPAEAPTTKEEPVVKTMVTETRAPRAKQAARSVSRGPQARQRDVENDMLSNVEDACIQLNEIDNDLDFMLVGRRTGR